MSEQNGAEAQTKSIRYLYLDVVGYTSARSVEAQSDIVDILNRLVLDSLARFNVDIGETVFLPTGDGMGIALLGESLPFDIHVQVGLEILERVHAHNETTADEMRQFTVRVGAGQNVDNIVTDINGAHNVAGAGINMTQRVMSVGDGSQLVVGEAVYDILSHRERYMNCFRPFKAKIKHGLMLPVYQYIEPGHPGLSTDIPAAFQIHDVEEQPLEIVEAFYMGHALALRDFLMRRAGPGRSNDILTIILWFLALDSVEASQAREFEKPRTRLHRGGDMPLREALRYYQKVDECVCVELSRFISESLSGIAHLFEPTSAAPSSLFFVSAAGRAKLSQDHPRILESFSIVEGGTEPTANTPRVPVTRCRPRPRPSVSDARRGQNGA